MKPGDLVRFVPRDDTFGLANTVHRPIALVVHKDSWATLIRWLDEPDCDDEDIDNYDNFDHAEGTGFRGEEWFEVISEGR